MKMYILDKQLAERFCNFRKIFNEPSTKTNVVEKLFTPFYKGWWW